jgi:hypothetical protein
MKKLNLFLMLVLFGFGVMAQTVEAQLTAAPDLTIQDGTATPMEVWAVSKEGWLIPINVYVLLATTCA